MDRGMSTTKDWGQWRRPSRRWLGCWASSWTITSPQTKRNERAVSRLLRGAEAEQWGIASMTAVRGHGGNVRLGGRPLIHGGTMFA